MQDKGMNVLCFVSTDSFKSYFIAVSGMFLGMALICEKKLNCSVLVFFRIEAVAKMMKLKAIILELFETREKNLMASLTTEESVVRAADV